MKMIFWLVIFSITVALYGQSCFHVDDIVELSPTVSSDTSVRACEGRD